MCATGTAGRQSRHGLGFIDPSRRVTLGHTLPPRGLVRFSALPLSLSTGNPAAGTASGRLITRARWFAPFPRRPPRHASSLSPATCPISRRRLCEGGGGAVDSPKPPTSASSQRHRQIPSWRKPKEQDRSRLGHQSYKALPLDLLGSQSHGKRECLAAPGVSMQAIQHPRDECITGADSAETVQHTG